jgi:hypothetical protein
MLTCRCAGGIAEGRCFDFDRNDFERFSSQAFSVQESEVRATLGIPAVDFGLSKFLYHLRAVNCQSQPV